MGRKKTAAKVGFDGSGDATKMGTTVGGSRQGLRRTTTTSSILPFLSQIQPFQEKQEREDGRPAYSSTSRSAMRLEETTRGPTPATPSLPFRWLALEISRRRRDERVGTRRHRRQRHGGTKAARKYG